MAHRIAGESGAFASTFESPADLQTAFDKLGQILWNSYIVEYKSDHTDKKTLQRPKVIAPGRKAVAVLVSISAPAVIRPVAGVCRMQSTGLRMLRFSMLTKPKLLLHVEGGAILVLCVFFYQQLQDSWLLFAILFLAPDLFMLGYLANVRIGSAVYNFAHTCITPGILLAIAYLAVRPQLFPIALIWTAHSGFDRLLGWGLKYPSNFKDTHLQHV